MPTKLSDEQRVRAAHPEACPVRIKSGTPELWWIWSEDVFDHNGGVKLGIGETELSAWHEASKELRIEHMADTPELPEMDVTEEEKALGRSKVFAMFGEGRSDLTRELINSEAELFCRERQLREAHATIAALRAQEGKHGND